MEPVKTATSIKVDYESKVPDGTLPVELLVEVFSYLKTLGDQASCALTCRSWNIVAHSSTLSYRKRKMILQGLKNNGQYIGPEALKRCIGDIGEFPPIPEEVFQVLESPCPENEGKKKIETHFLAFIPKTINSSSLTLNFLNKIIKNPKEGYSTKFGFYFHKIKEMYGDKPYLKPSWVLMTKNVLKGSRNKSREELFKIASEHGAFFRPPTLLEASFILTMLYVIYGKRYFKAETETSTCCLEKPIDGCKLAVGEFADTGYIVLSSGLYLCCVHECYSVGPGVAPLRRFG